MDTAPQPAVQDPQKHSGKNVLIAFVILCIFQLVFILWTVERVNLHEQQPKADPIVAVTPVVPTPAVQDPIPNPSTLHTPVTLAPEAPKPVPALVLSNAPILAFGNAIVLPVTQEQFQMLSTLYPRNFTNITVTFNK